MKKTNNGSWKIVNQIQCSFSLQNSCCKSLIVFCRCHHVSILLYCIWLKCLLLCSWYRYNRTLVAVFLLILYSLLVHRCMNKLMWSDELMKWDMCGAYIVIDLLEDTSVVSLASCIKVKVAVGPHEYWRADEPVLQNWVIGSVLISIWRQYLNIMTGCQKINEGFLPIFSGVAKMLYTICLKLKKRKWNSLFATLWQGESDIR